MSWRVNDLPWVVSTNKRGLAAYEIHAKKRGNAMKKTTRILRHLEKKWARGIIVALLGLGIGVLVSAQDLSDNETCLACHVAFEWLAPENSDRPRVHNDDGTFTQQTHEMWSCTNCHEDITEIPHRTDVERGVDCLNCHEAVPEK
jgi:hypothetical protein